MLAPDVTIEGIMSVAPDLIVVTILLLAGLLVKPGKDIPKVGPAPTYEMIPEQEAKDQAHLQQQPWVPHRPAQGHVAQHYYEQ